MGYSPVYSAAFIEYTAETPNLSFEVPPGFTAVARFGVVSQDIGGYTASFYFQNSEEAPSITFWNSAGISEYTTSTFDGRVVIPENGIISLFLSSLGSRPQAYLGGYLLRNVVA